LEIKVTEDVKHGNDAFAVFRVIGWEMHNDKAYWLVSFTMDQEWGMFNYALIEQNTGLTFTNIQFESK
jgi:hypothetical protein